MVVLLFLIETPSLHGILEWKKAFEENVVQSEDLNTVIEKAFMPQHWKNTICYTLGTLSSLCNFMYLFIGTV